MLSPHGHHGMWKPLGMLQFHNGLLYRIAPSCILLAIFYYKTITQLGPKVGMAIELDVDWIVVMTVELSYALNVESNNQMVDELVT